MTTTTTTATTNTQSTTQNNTHIPIFNIQGNNDANITATHTQHYTNNNFGVNVDNKTNAGNELPKDKTTTTTDANNNKKNTMKQRTMQGGPTNDRYWIERLMNATSNLVRDPEKPKHTKGTANIPDFVHGILTTSFFINHTAHTQQPKPKPDGNDDVDNDGFSQVGRHGRKKRTPPPPSGSPASCGH
jgi:hypothetical protein